MARLLDLDKTRKKQLLMKIINTDDVKSKSN